MTHDGSPTKTAPPTWGRFSFPGGRRAARRAREGLNVLDLVPVRLANWEDGDRQVVLIRPHPRAPWYLLPLEWLRYLLAVRRIRLDATASAAWRACDGRRSVAAVAAIVRDAFGADAEPVEQRVGWLIRRLRHEGLLAYRDHDDLRAPPGHPLAPPSS